jgi:hypothetical protein
VATRWRAVRLFATRYIRSIVSAQGYAGGLVSLSLTGKGRERPEADAGLVSENFTRAISPFFPLSPTPCAQHIGADRAFCLVHPPSSPWPQRCRTIALCICMGMVRVYRAAASREIWGLGSSPWEYACSDVRRPPVAPRFPLRHVSSPTARTYRRGRSARPADREAGWVSGCRAHRMIDDNY